MSPKVSIIIPFYHHADWLEESLESVFSQTYSQSDIEVFVIIDGSKENVEHIKNRYIGRVNFISQENLGAGPARNCGIEAATGDYIAFLDADDIWLPDKLSIQVNAMEANEALWSYTSYETFGKVQRRVIVGERVTNRFPQILCSSSIATPTVMIRRSAFISDPTLRFDASLRNGQDYELWIRLSQIHDILAIKEVGAKVRIRDGSTMNSVIRQLRVRALLAERVGCYSDDRRCSFFCKRGYICSKKAYSLFTKFEKRIDHPQFLQVIAAALYLIPYTLFKIGLLCYR